MFFYCKVTIANMTIRMKDIAKDLGISQATVSKVLRDHPDIGEATRQRVLERVKELDYQPNTLARSLGRPLDALVIASTSSSFEQFERMDSKGQPYVLIDRDLPGLAANFVGT